MLSYVYFGTNDLGKAIAFYNATLASVGMAPVQVRAELAAKAVTRTSRVTAWSALESVTLWSAETLPRCRGHRPRPS
jgi:hypothetical protein